MIPPSPRPAPDPGDRRRPRTLPFAAWLVLALIPLAAGCRSTPAPTRAASEPFAFRVMTYNIHHGEGTDKRLDLERIARLILDQRADIVALQEVDRGVERTRRRDLPAELAALTRMTCIFSNNFAYQGGEYGNAVLTRFPVRSSTNTHFRMLRSGEQRGVLQVHLVLPGNRPLLVLSTHLDFRRDDTERLSNIPEIEAIARAHPDVPLLVCGDFNDVPGSGTHQAMARLFDDAWPLAGEGDGFTIPSTGPNKRIDFVWIRRPSPLSPRRAWVPESLASDHCAVVVSFETP